MVVQQVRCLLLDVVDPFCYCTVQDFLLLPIHLPSIVGQSTSIVLGSGNRATELLGFARSFARSFPFFPDLIIHCHRL